VSALPRKLVSFISKRVRRRKKGKVLLVLIEGGPNHTDWSDRPVLEQKSIFSRGGSDALRYLRPLLSVSGTAGLGGGRPSNFYSWPGGEKRKPLEGGSAKLSAGECPAAQRR